MKTNRGVLFWFDVSVQMLLIASIILAAAYSLYTGEAYYALSMVLLLPLGVWQLASAFFRLFGTELSAIRTYFVAALTYCFMLFVGTTLISQLELPDWLGVVAFSLGFIAIPFSASLAYLYLCFTSTSKQLAHDL